MIKIEFPADRQDIAAAIGAALTKIGEGCTKVETGYTQIGRAHV